MYYTSKAAFAVSEIWTRHEAYLRHYTPCSAHGMPGLCTCCVLSAMALSSCTQVTNNYYPPDNDVYYHPPLPRAGDSNCVDDDFPGASC